MVGSFFFFKFFHKRKFEWRWNDPISSHEFKCVPPFNNNRSVLRFFYFYNKPITENTRQELTDIPLICDCFFFWTSDLGSSEADCAWIVKALECSWTLLCSVASRLPHWDDMLAIESADFLLFQEQDVAFLFNIRSTKNLIYFFIYVVHIEMALQNNS